MTAAIAAFVMSSASLAAPNANQYRKNVVIGEKSGRVWDASTEVIKDNCYINSVYYFQEDAYVGPGIRVDGGSSLSNYENGAEDFPELLRQAGVEMYSEYVDIYGVWYCPNGDLRSPSCTLLERPFAINGKRVR